MGRNDTPIRQPGAAVLLTSGQPQGITAGQIPTTVVGLDPNRRALIIDNEGTVDLFVSEDDGGQSLLHGGGVRIAAGTSRTMLVSCAVRIFCPAGGPNGLYRYAIETD